MSLASNQTQVWEERHEVGEGMPLSVFGNPMDSSLLCFQPRRGFPPVKLTSRGQALKRPVLQSQPSLSFPEEPANPQEDLLSLGETEAERAGCCFKTGLCTLLLLTPCSSYCAPIVAPG